MTTTTQNDTRVSTQRVDLFARLVQRYRLTRDHLKDASPRIEGYEGEPERMSEYFAEAERDLLLAMAVYLGRRMPAALRVGSTILVARDNPLRGENYTPDYLLLVVDDADIIDLTNEAPDLTNESP